MFVNLNYYSFILISFSYVSDNKSVIFIFILDASLGNDIYANYTAYLFNNHIVLAYNETQNEAVYGAGLTEVNTTFEITRIDSSITFSAGMVFEYGTSGTIHVIVEGGSIKKENITVLNHPEAKISFTNNVLTVSGLASPMPQG